MNSEQIKYHERQMKKTYRSTEVFVSWLESKNYLKRNEKLSICDMACGGGCQ